MILGLGNSVGTAPEGVEGELLIVSGSRSSTPRARIKGQIVLFNVPFTNYGETVSIRTAGPSRAARAGAVATSCAPWASMACAPAHRMLNYRRGPAKIPAAAIAVEDAHRLQRLADRGTSAPVAAQDGSDAGDADSVNVVGEIRGRERPDEVVVMGGHFDSWDVGTGSTDDGGGCMVTWEALRLMKTLGLRPRRTVRVVLFTNEENGLRGGLAYRDQHRAELADHVMMLESDGGVFRPNGFGFTGNDSARARPCRAWPRCSRDPGRCGRPSGGGADIGRAYRPGKFQPWRSTWMGRSTSCTTTPVPTLSTSSTRSMWRAVPRRSR